MGTLEVSTSTNPGEIMKHRYIHTRLICAFVAIGLLVACNAADEDVEDSTVPEKGAVSQEPEPEVMIPAENQSSASTEPAAVQPSPVPSTAPSSDSHIVIAQNDTPVQQSVNSNESSSSSSVATIAVLDETINARGKTVVYFDTENAAKTYLIDPTAKISFHFPCNRADTLQCHLTGVNKQDVEVYAEFTRSSQFSPTDLNPAGERTMAIVPLSGYNGIRCVKYLLVGDQLTELSRFNYKFEIVE